jgi:hypothetical protein
MRSSAGFGKGALSPLPIEWEFFINKTHKMSNVNDPQSNTDDEYPSSEEEPELSGFEKEFKAIQKKGWKNNVPLDFLRLCIKENRFDVLKLFARRTSFKGVLKELLEKNEIETIRLLIDNGIELPATPHIYEDEERSAIILEILKLYDYHNNDTDNAMHAMMIKNPKLLEKLPLAGIPGVQREGQNVFKPRIQNIRFAVENYDKLKDKNTLELLLRHFEPTDSDRAKIRTLIQEHKNTAAILKEHF